MKYRMNYAPCLALFAACLAHLFWGSVTTATYYINAIKVQDNYSVSQVELMLPMLSIGKVFSPISAAVFQTWGATLTTTLGMIFTSGGFVLMWWTTASSYTTNISFIYVFFFMMGLGSSFFNLSLLTVVTKSFDKHRGKAVSILMTCYGVSPLFSLLIYRHWFAFDIIDDDTTQDVSGFMLFSAVSTSAVGVLCLVFVRVHKDAPDTTDVPLIHKMEQDEQVVNKNQTVISHWATCIFAEAKLFCQWRLQLTLWVFAFIYAMFCSIDYNLALYAKSSGKYYIFDNCFAIFHVTVFFARLAIGFISDFFEAKIHRMFYISVSSCVLTVCLCLASIIPLDEGMLYFMSLSAGLAGGIFRPLIVTLISKQWKERDFAKIWGVTYCTASVVLTIWLAVFSWLYSSATEVNDGTECYGTSCLKWVNVISCGIMLLATIFSCALSVTKKL